MNLKILSIAILAVLLALPLHAALARSYGQVNDFYITEPSGIDNCSPIWLPVAGVQFNMPFSAKDTTFGQGYYTVQWNVQSTSGYWAQAVVLAEGTTLVYAVQVWSGSTNVFSASVNFVNSHNFTTNDGLTFYYRVVSNPASTKQEFNVSAIYNGVTDHTYSITVPNTYGITPKNSVLQFIGAGSGSHTNFHHLNATVTEGASLSGDYFHQGHIVVTNVPANSIPCGSAASAESSNVSDTNVVQHLWQEVYRTTSP